jgi:hypothetical protein
MINSPNNQLDEFLKETLKNHEVPFNEAHWNEFESKLTTRPRVSVSNNWRFSLNIFIGLVVAGSASAFIYNKVTSPSAANTKPTVSKTENQNTIDQKSITKNSTSVIDSYNSTKDPVVVNPVSDNNTYSIFTSEDISNTSTQPDVNTAKPTGYLMTANNPNANAISKTINKPVDNENIDPNELQKQLDLAKIEDKSRAVFPDMLDKHDGAIYNTKESDTVKEKAEKDFLKFFLNNQNGNPNTDAVRSFMDKTEKKDDNGIKITNDKNYVTPLPADTTATNNNQ